MSSTTKRYLIGPLFLITLVAGVPYQLFFDGSRGAGNNTLTLLCRNFSDGNPVPRALFYRNSQLNTSDSTCFKNSSSLPDHELQFTLTPDCDGYFSCGKKFSNGREILSGPKAAYAYPRTNDSARTVVTEIGKSVLLTCDFVPSPINTYATTWYRGRGSQQELLATFPQLQSFLLSDLQSSDEDFYSCQIKPSERNAGLPFYNGPFITLKLIERYVTPSITRDLNYTRSADGYNVFSVSTSGTNLTHEWYINGTLVNRTQSAVDGVTVAGVSADSLSIKLTKCGSLRVAHVISNMDHAGLNHSTRQNFGFYNVCSEPQTGPSTNMEQCEFFTETMKGVAVLVALALSALVNVIFIVAAVYFCCRQRKLRTSDKEQDNTHVRPPDLSIKSNQIIRFDGCSSTSTPASTPDSQNLPFTNPLADILRKVAQMISDSQDTDINLLFGLNTVIGSAVVVCKGRECAEATQKISNEILDVIKSIRFESITVDSSQSSDREESPEPMTADGGKNYEGVPLVGTKRQRSLEEEEERQLQNLLDEMCSHLRSHH